MEINIDKDDLLKALFVIYVIVCILCTSLITAFLIVPLAMWANLYLFYQPVAKGLCMISNDRERCMYVMEEVAEELELKQVIIYEEVELNKFEHVGIIELQDEVDVDMDLDEDD
tara:strand:+ start:87 stop:428 length:342 start_codon:yes stop_codon:yes gene_type:complete